MKQIFYGHTKNDANGRPTPESEWQPLAIHLQNVANIAAEFAKPLGLETEARIAGLLHDLGKYSQRFQDRLRDHSIHGINHWAAGTVQSSGMIRYAIDGHHTGLPSFRDLKQTVLRFEQDPYDLTKCNESNTELMKRFADDGLCLPQLTQRKTTQDHFANAMRTRLLFSALVDADFLDTENHFKPQTETSRVVPSLNAKSAMDALAIHMGRFQMDGHINQLRRRLLDDCILAADKPLGLFTLTAPTGSGKTLASLAFALRHAMIHDRRRIIVVIPYTSIIEQTARVYRNIFEPLFGPDYILEHHSAVAPRETEDDLEHDSEDERLRRARLASENWVSPLITTTSVRFFESLFSNKPSACRKLHNIANSVVIFDEVQTLPDRLVPSLLSAVRLLQRDYGVTVLFMTATQPAFTSIKNALPYGWDPVEISSNPNAIADTMQRTTITLPSRDEKITWPDLATELTGHRQTLCVVNTTKDARYLFSLLPAQDRFHLSARMCPSHRYERLAAIRQRLTDRQPCRLISTQLIEAGVDVDFPVVYRAMGPLDSIIQTAGRCNREGLNPTPQPVIVFRPADGGTPPGAYKTATSKTEEFLARHPDIQLHQPDTYAKYFTELYSLLGPQAPNDDPVFKASVKFNFPAANKECSIVGQDTVAVLVRWGEGADLAEKLARYKFFTADECRSAQRFSVNLYLHEVFIDIKSKVLQPWIVKPADGWNFFVWNSQYDDDLGAFHLEANNLIC